MNSLIICLSVIAGLICFVTIPESAEAFDFLLSPVYENDSIGAKSADILINQGQAPLFEDTLTSISSDNYWVINEQIPQMLYSIESSFKIDYEAYAPENNGQKIYTLKLADSEYFQISLTVLNKLEVEDQSMGISENASNGDVVGVVYVSAYDQADFSPTFTITSGNTHNVFAVSNASGGSIVVNDATILDYESINSYLLSVQVANRTYTETAVISISVTNVKDSPVIITDQSFSIDENSHGGSTVGAVDVQDTYHYNLTYDITAGNTENAFTIGSSNGIISVIDKHVLDYETNRNYTLTIQVAGGEYSPSSQVLINVNDVNESPVASNQSFSILENSTLGTIAYTVIATDPDNDSLSYYITGGNVGNAFSISETTGEMRVAGSLNFESLSTYDLIVNVRDSEYTEIATISIVLIDENDPPSLSNQTISINETSQAFRKKSICFTIALLLWIRCKRTKDYDA